MRRVIVIACVMLASCAAGCSPSTAARTTSNASPTGPTRSTALPSPPSASPSPQSTLTPSPAPYPRLPIPAGTTRCHTSQLEAAFDVLPPAAGNLEYVFVLRNKSTTGCWVYGFVGLQTLDSQGRLLPQSVSWWTTGFFGRSDPPTRIMLPAGTAPLESDGPGHAFFNVTTDDVRCDISQAGVSILEIWPPDETQPLKIPARTSDGRTFGFCVGFGLNPLQTQSIPVLD